MVAMVMDKLVLSVCTYNKCSKWCSFTYTHAQSLCFRLITSLPTASMLVAVHAARGLLLLDRLSRYRSSLYQTLNKIVQHVFLPSFSRKVCFPSELAYASLSWQRLQLVLRYINNFNGKVSSIDEQLNK